MESTDLPGIDLALPPPDDDSSGSLGVSLDFAPPPPLDEDEDGGVSLAIPELPTEEVDESLTAPELPLEVDVPALGEVALPGVSIEAPPATEAASACAAEVQGEEQDADSEERRAQEEADAAEGEKKAAEQRKQAEAASQKMGQAFMCTFADSLDGVCAQLEEINSTQNRLLALLIKERDMVGEAAPQLKPALDLFAQLPDYTEKTKVIQRGMKSLLARSEKVAERSKALQMKKAKDDAEQQRKLELQVKQEKEKEKGLLAKKASHLRVGDDDEEDDDDEPLLVI